MITPDTAAPAANELCVPAKALEIEGASPAEGDEVECVMRGKVSRIEGEEVYITPTEVNGQAIVSEGPESTEPTADDMMELARQADAQS